MSEPIATLRKVQGRYELSFPEKGLVIRGHHPEWVMEAAGEVLADVEKRILDGEIEEATVMAEMGEGSSVQVDSLKFAAKSRFEILPQCLVSLGDLDFRWVSKDSVAPGASEAPNSRFTRLQDQALTRNDTFLQNEQPNA